MVIFLSATHWSYICDTAVAIDLRSAVSSTEFACKVMCLMFLRKGRTSLHLLLFVVVVTFVTCNWYGGMRLYIPNHLMCSSKKWFYSLCGFKHSQSFGMLEELGPFTLVLLLERQES